MIEKAARETGGIVTCEEHNILAGFGSAVSEVICEKYPIPMRRIGVRDQFGESARDSEISLLLQKHGITSIHIANAVKDIKGRIR
jgi:transketolase